MWRLFASVLAVSVGESVEMSSSVTVGFRDAIPDAQTWSRVRWTTMTKGTLLLHDPEHSAEFRPEKLSGSRWRLFFHDESDSVVGKWTDEPFDQSQCDVLFEHAVRVVNVLTWQVGHLLIDVLEPLFYHGEDVQLILHVANEDERTVLEEKVRRTVYEDDTPFGLLRNFTNKPIMTRNQLMSLGDKLCFADISFELDITSTYYSLGSVENSRASPLDNPDVKASYAAFKTFLNKGLVPTIRQREKKHIVFVRRKGSRRLVNIDDLMSIAEAVAKDGDDFHVSVASLEEMTFTEQINLFKSVDVLVAQYGTAAHNVLFMRPGTVLVLLMQPDWCDYAWHYANQALLSDVETVCVCEQSSSSSRAASFRWTHRAWRQGPWISKDADFAVDSNLFRRAIDLAIHNATKTASVSYVVLDEEDDDALEVDSPSPVRVHISDVRIERQAENMAKVSLVAEVVGTPTNQSPSLVFVGLERKWLDDDRILLCVTADQTTCFSSSAFNEFSTVDLTVPWGDTVNLRCWLALDGQEMAGSETYWTAVIDTEYSGLGVSTITHTPAPAFRGRQQDQRDFVVDWRVFRLGETLEVPVVLDGQIVHFEARLDLRTGLQRKLAEFCRVAHLDTTTCFDLTRAIESVALSRMKAGRLGLPSVQDVPTVERPFVFLHNEKTAGSTVRRDVVDAAKRIGTAFYVPCYDENGIYREDERCYGFDLSNTTQDVSKLAVVAGHFEWKVWDTLPSSTGTEDDRACFTTIRHPVDKAISLYYERVYQRDDELGGRLMNDLDPEYLRWLLREFKGSAFGKYRDEGMCNTMCKMFLDLNVHKGRSPRDLEIERARDPERFAALEHPLNVTLAKDRLSRCIVGFQDDWPATERTLSFWFPWISRMTKDEGAKPRRRLNVGPSDAETRSSLRASLRSEIEACNECDLALYDHALRLRKVQDLVVKY